MRSSARPILVTGATGRIGSVLVPELLDSGNAVRAFVLPHDPGIRRLDAHGVQVVPGDLTDAAAVAQAAQGVRAIVHLGAAMGRFTERQFFETNMRGTFDVLEAARRAGGVQRLVFASTDALYPKYVPGGISEPITEATPPVPSGWYALSKWLAEAMCQRYWRDCGLPTVSLRFAFVVGLGEILDRDRCPWFWLERMRGTAQGEARAVLDAAWQAPEPGRREDRLLLSRVPDGRPTKKHVVDVRDVTAAIRAALEAERAPGEILQLGGPAPLRWDDAVPYLSQRLGLPFVDLCLPGVPTHYEYDTSRARAVLGWTPCHDLSSMVDAALSSEGHQ